MTKKKFKDYSPKIYIKDSYKTGKRIVTWRFDRLFTKRRTFPSRFFYQNIHFILLEMGK